MSIKKRYLLIIALFSVGSVAGPVDFTQLYDSWSYDGDLSSIATKGQKMWSDEMIPGRSCSSCHGNDLSRSGEHVKTNKAIKPLSPKANPKRLTKVRKINKWLKRNCKWTYKRECTTEEKVSFIEFIRTN
jgi:hypothetical protein